MKLLPNRSLQVTGERHGEDRNARQEKDRASPVAGDRRAHARLGGALSQEHESTPYQGHPRQGQQRQRASCGRHRVDRFVFVRLLGRCGGRVLVCFLQLRMFGRRLRLRGRVFVGFCDRDPVFGRRLRL